MLRSRGNRVPNPNVPTRKIRPLSSKKKSEFSLTSLIALILGVILVIIVVAFLALEHDKLSKLSLGSGEADVVVEDRSQDHIQESSDRKKDAIDQEEDVAERQEKIKNMPPPPDDEKVEDKKEEDEFASLSEDDLAKMEKEARDKVRKLKAGGMIMETDPKAKEPIEKLQKVTRALILRRYGKPPFRVEMEVKFPAIMPDNPPGRILIELAPIELVPHVVFTFLEIVRNWQGGAFNRVAGHVLQTRVSGQRDGLAFQEYHPDFPHEKFTLGYAGRPGGPPFYINIIDNTRNHGPGSQGSSSEADGCFGKVLEGFDVIERIKKHPKTENMGFIHHHDDQIDITKLELLKRPIKS